MGHYKYRGVHLAGPLGGVFPLFWPPIGIVHYCNTIHRGSFFCHPCGSSGGVQRKTDLENGLGYPGALAILCPDGACSHGPDARGAYRYTYAGGIKLR